MYPWPTGPAAPSTQPKAPPHRLRGTLAAPAGLQGATTTDAPAGESEAPYVDEEAENTQGGPLTMDPTEFPQTLQYEDAAIRRLLTHRGHRKHVTRLLRAASEAAAHGNYRQANESRRHATQAVRRVLGAPRPGAIPPPPPHLPAPQQEAWTDPAQH